MIITNFECTVFCDYEGCEEWNGIEAGGSIEHAEQLLHTFSKRDGWTMFGKKHYCPKHKPEEL